MNSDPGIEFLQWALPQMGYRWAGFRKPRSQVLKRIQKRMQELRLSGGYSEYKKFLEEHPDEWEQLDRLCDVTVSKFFRDRKLWDFLREHVLGEQLRIADAGPVTVWSAGCCNGEEPYSIAILAEQICGEASAGRTISILATDRNADVLARARKGLYPHGALKELTEQEIRMFFRPVENKSTSFKIDERLVRTVRFEQRDIRKSLPNSVFDLIFCRNLAFTYFTEENRQAFLQRLKPCMKPGGRLVTGSNETLNEADWLERESPAHPVYRKTALPGVLCHN